MEFKELLNYGVAVACLVAVGIAFWRVLVWFRSKADALIASHLKLIDALKEQAPKQTAALEQIAGASEEQSAHLLKITSVQEQIAKDQKAAVKLESDCVGQLKLLNAELKRQTGEVTKLAPKEA